MSSIGTELEIDSVPPAVVLDNIFKQFGSDSNHVVNAIQGVSMHIEQHAFAALTGPSGSGKSTLLNIIGTLDVPNQGSVQIGGKRIHYADERATELLRQTQIGFIFQTFNLLPVLTAQENVEMALLVSSIPTKTRKMRAAEALHKVGLADRLHHRPSALSGGQQQRVAVARALVKNPMLVLADEPTANLDSTSAFSLIDLLQQINRDHGTTFLFSTHDHRLLNQVEQIFALEDGHLI